MREKSAVWADVKKGDIWDETEVRGNPASLSFTNTAKKQLHKYARDERLFKLINTALEKMKENIDHPSLRAKKYKGSSCPHDKNLFEAYVSQTKGGHRIFYCLDPDRANTYMILSIEPHE